MGLLQTQQFKTTNSYSLIANERPESGWLSQNLGGLARRLWRKDPPETADKLSAAAEL